ncbi:MAG: DUF2145 domain-containing protein [Pseudomonadota bacterium]
MKSSQVFVIALACAAALLAAPARAGRSCEARKPSAESIIKGLALAQKTAQSLDASGAAVVVLARAGQDLRKYGLDYSHVGLAYRQPAPGGGYHWRVVHKLNQCGSAQSSLYRQGLGEFFLDDPWRFDAAWAALQPELQARLLPVLRDNARVAALHEPHYSVVSYAWGRKYQQSNQWAIETLAAAMDDRALSRDQAQAWLRQNGYQPTTLQLGALTRLGARVTSANVAFDDHPPARRFADRIDTVTADSVFDWLQRSQLGGAMQRVQ